MSSPYSCPEEGWSICSSLKTNSVDCDLLLEFDTPPGSNENFDIIKTDESVDGAPSIISCSPTNTTTSFHTACENFLPYPADISQWVHQQSLLVGSPLERTTNSVASSPDTKEINMFPESLDDSVEAFEPSPMVYDIPTLLFLGKMPMSHMTELRVHSGALAANVFKHDPYDECPKFGVMSHHHETPTDSNSIRQGRNSDDETLAGDSSGVVLNFPSRQPRSPPGRKSRQKQEGFKRFLKQVASPPHHRVTAGGRIVPFAPQTPPPIMNFGSIDNAILQSAMSKQFRGKPTDLEAFKDRVERITVPQSRSSVSSNLDTTLSSTSNQRQAIAKYDTDDAWYAFWDEQKVFSQRMALSSPPPAGEVLVPFNGIWYRVFWIGNTMFNEPLQFNPSLGLQTVAYPTSYGRQPIVPQHNSMTPPIMVSNSQMSFSNVPNSSSVSLLQHQGTQFGVEALTRSYNILNAHLEKLDKHLSLKFNKLTPRETFALTEERKNLIIHTNFLRVSIVKLTCGSNVNSNFQTFRSSGDPQCLAFDTASRPPTAPLEPDQDIKQKSIKDGNGVTSSYLSKPSMGQQSFLSPNAPAFVPSNKKATLSIPNGHETQEEAGQNQGVGQMPIFNGDDTASQDSVGSGIKNATEQLLSDVDEIETPAELLPVITQKQIEYAQTLNSPNGEKVYCSTVEDVAEVIRRVREQATMYGCEGGQSKDPAYDAEQDIHWEIHEKAPILLPGPISDHVANPRPWDWKSSAYNPKAEANKKPPASRMHSLSFKSATSRNSAPPPSKSAGGNHNKTILPSILEEESNHEERLFDRISHRRTGSLYSEDGLDDAPMNSKDEIYGLDAVEMAGALSAGVNLDITIPNFQELVAKTSAAILDGSFDLAQYTKSGPTSTLRKSEVEDKKSATIANDNTEKEIRRPYQAYVEDDDTDVTSLSYQSVRTPSTAAPISSNPSVSYGAQPSSNDSIVGNASPNGVNHPGAQPIPIPVRSTSRFDPRTLASPRGLSLLSVPVDDLNDPRMWETAVNPVWDWGTGDLIGLGEYSPGPEVFGPSDGNYTIDYLDDPMTNSETQNTMGSNGINARVGRTTEPKPPACAQNSLPADVTTHHMSSRFNPKVQSGPTTSGATTGFLRGMLKNPQFSTKHNENKSKATMKKQTRGHKNIDVGSEVRATKKENQKNKKGRSKKGPAKKGQFRSTVPLMASQDIRVQKAQSSLASSNYHASGYLPQRDCSEDPSTSLASQAYGRINQGVGTDASTPKSGMPRNTGRYTKTQELPEERDPRQYDGAGDLHYKSTIFEHEDASSAGSSDREVRKRVTIDDFNIYRRQFLPGAKLAIDRFFRELRDKECEMIKKSQCAKPETC